MGGKEGTPDDLVHLSRVKCILDVTKNVEL
jgi:hypothetical protein